MVFIDFLALISSTIIFVALDTVELSCYDNEVLGSSRKLEMQTTKLTEFENFLINVSDSLEDITDVKHHTNSSKIHNGSQIVKACLISIVLLWGHM